MRNDVVQIVDENGSEVEAKMEEGVLEVEATKHLIQDLRRLANQQMEMDLKKTFLFHAKSGDLN